MSLLEKKALDKLSCSRLTAEFIIALQRKEAIREHEACEYSNLVS